MIRFDVKNVGVSAEEVVALRKFYQVIFFDLNISQVVIYTAIVIGDVKDKNKYFPDKRKGGKKRKFIHTSGQLAVKCSCSCNDSEIGYLNVTDEILKDERWGHAWGGAEACKVFDEPRKCRDAIVDCMSCFFPDVGAVDGDLRCPKELYSIYESSKGRDNSHRVLAEPVSISSNSNGYMIRVDLKDKYFCVDYINWAKTTVKLNKSSVEQEDLYSYSLKFVDRFVVDDMSLYFVLPYRCRVDEDEQSGYYVVNQTSSNIESKQPFDNAVSRVKRNEKAYLRCWVDDFDISSRYVYRVRKDFVDSASLSSGLKEITLVMPVYSEVSTATFNYVVPFVCAVFLAFSVDKTRVEAYKDYFWGVEYVPADVQWLLGTMSLAFMFPLVVFNSSENEPCLVRWIRFVAYAFLAIWGIVTYWIGQICVIAQPISRLFGIMLLASFALFILSIFVANIFFKKSYANHKIKFKF